VGIYDIAAKLVIFIELLAGRAGQHGEPEDLRDLEGAEYQGKHG